MILGYSRISFGTEIAVERSRVGVNVELRRREMRERRLPRLAWEHHARFNVRLKIPELTLLRQEKPETRTANRIPGGDPARSHLILQPMVLGP
jgi:hypothetical protein